MSSANLAGRAHELPLPGKLALLAFRPSRELAAIAMQTLSRGRVSHKIHGGDRREVSNLLANATTGKPQLLRHLILN